MAQADLVQRARDGDREAFARLAADQADRLYATAFLILRSPDAARDAAQEALLDAWRGLRGLREADRFGPWLNRLLVRRCARHRTRADRELNVDIVDPRQAPDAADRIADRDELERGFRRLTAEQRMVLVLRFYYDLSVEQVADELALPVGTVKSRTNRALAAMRSALQAEARGLAPAAGGSDEPL